MEIPSEEPVPQGPMLVLDNTEDVTKLGVQSI